MTWVFTLLVIPTILFCGVYVVALLDVMCTRLFMGQPAALLIEGPVVRALHDLRRQIVHTEAPDRVNQLLAPALYLGLAALALALVPAGPGRVLLDTPVGIVVWGAVETLTVVAVFLHGWSRNSLFPLMGGYRFVATGLSAMLLSMFVLIGTALPAESLSLPAIVASQNELWNVIRQPLGLPLFMLLGLSISLRGPMDYADSPDLAGGTSAEDSGALGLAWQIARMAMLTGFSAVAASAFLGGWQGPLLPGPVWLLIKTLFLMAVMVLASHLIARPDVSRAMTLIWTVLLPLAFLDLAIAGLGSLP